MNRAYNTLTSTGLAFPHYNKAYSVSLQTGSIVFTTMNQAYNTVASTGSIFQHYSRAYSTPLKQDPEYSPL